MANPRMSLLQLLDKAEAGADPEFLRNGLRLLVEERVTDLIAEPILGQLLEGTAQEVGISVQAHPTLSEAVGEAALAVDGRAIHA